MARRTTRSTPRADQSQSNTVLIVFVVISMLANVGLGIMWYLSQEEIVNSKKAATDAQAQQNQAVRDKNLIQDFYVTRLRIWLGDKPSETEVEAMKRAGSDVMQAPQEWFMPLARKIEGDPNANDAIAKAGMIGPFDPARGTTANNFSDRLKSLDDTLVKLRRDLKDSQDKQKTLTEEYNTYKNEWNARVLEQKVKASQDRYEADLKEKLAQKDSEINDLKAKINSVEKEVAKILADTKTSFDQEKQKLTERFDAALLARDQELKEIREKIKAGNEVVLDKPRGRIVRADPSGDRVVIDVGSDMSLQPQTTFSVYGRDSSGKPFATPKARIEVVEVLGRTSALAIVRQMAKPEEFRKGVESSDPAYWISNTRDFWRSNNPILPGDLIYNPAWEPNRRIHVALAGFFDIDGDGQDDLQSFVRILQSLGVDVDVYLDSADDYKPKGRMTNQTELLIIGSAPLIATKGEAPKAVGGGRMNEAVNALQNEARNKGIEIVTLNRFLDRMGFVAERIPQLQGSANKPKAPGSAPSNPPAPKNGNGTETDK